MPMPQPVERKGRPASPGIFAGPIVQLVRPDLPDDEANCDALAEEDALRDAIELATAELEALHDGAPEEAKGIVEFQLAMLDDPSLLEPLMERIMTGRSAAYAWQSVLAAQVADYEAADDDYFRARAGDLADLKDRVLSRLSGEADAALPAGAIPMAGRSCSSAGARSAMWRSWRGRAACRW
jgi:phosphotransferase system enzyme I (PtsI)